MKAVVLRQPGGPENLETVDRPTPTPGPGEVLVRLRAATLNYRDLVVLRGGYRKRQKQADLIPLSDGAGEIAAVGPGVDSFKEGDRVVGGFFPDWHGGPLSQRALESDHGRVNDGVLVEYRVFPAHGVLRFPDHLSFEQAAALPCAGLTAWSATVGQGIGPGDLMLTQGTGGVSLFALQFAKLAGAEVIATSSSPAKLERARDLGADHLIDYRETPEWGRIALDLAAPRDGVDLVIELGGQDTIKQSLTAIRPGGSLAMIGVLSGAGFGDALLPFVVSRQVRLQGVTVGSMADFQRMLHAVEAHELTPVMDRTFPLAEAAAAYQHLAAGKHFGKVAIAI